MDWQLTRKDFENARLLLKRELISPINQENMFRAGLYCILSAAEKYSKHNAIYYELLENEIDTPDAILSNKRELTEIIQRARYPNAKEKHIRKFASWWLESDLPDEIMIDIYAEKKKEFALRNRLAEEAPGIWYKGASLFMIKCGYENVVPVDLWVLRFLEENGHDVSLPHYVTVRSPNYKERSGPTPKEYLQYEKVISDAAKEYLVSPALFQFILWSKYSTWKKTKLKA